MIGLYLRVSTKDQSIVRQRRSTSDYAGRVFDVSSDEIVIYKDKSTGTNIRRSGYASMMEDAEAGEIEAVVVHSISRVARSISDLEKTASRLESAGVELHIVSEGLSLKPGESDPYQTALFQLLGVFAELEAAITRQRVRDGIAARQESEDYHHGPAPLGFEKQDGVLVEAENYHEVSEHLSQVKKGNLSKRKAAKYLDTSRPTINRALDREEMYGLTDQTPRGVAD